MDFFVRKHQKKINGTLGCFDRMLFRGYLPIQSGWAMAQFLNQNQISFVRLKDFLIDNANKINQHAKTMAAKLHRPFQYLTVPTRKEDLARKMAEDEGIKRGLVCIFSVLEPCRTFSFKFEKGRPFVQSARRKCLFIYFYFMDREFGLIHVKLQTWFPMQIQVYLNGHDWLERKLTANGISFIKHDNVFLRVAKLGARADACGSLYRSGLAADPGTICALCQSTIEGLASRLPALLGYIPERVLHGYHF
jgi:hypothetical protein